MGIEQGVVKRAARFALPVMIAGAGFFGCGRDGDSDVKAAVAPTIKVPPATATQEIPNSPTPESTPTIQPRPTSTEPPPTAIATGTATPKPPEATATPIPEKSKFPVYAVYKGKFGDELGGGAVVVAFPNGTMGVAVLKNLSCGSSQMEQIRFFKGTPEGDHFSIQNSSGGKIEGSLTSKGIEGKLNFPTMGDCDKTINAPFAASFEGYGGDKLVQAFAEIWNGSRDYSKSPIDQQAAANELKKPWGVLP